MKILLYVIKDKIKEKHFVKFNKHYVKQELVSKIC